MTTSSPYSPLPDGWHMARLGELCSSPEYGAAATAIEHDSSLPRYVRITDITDAGRLREDEKRSADPEDVDGFELEEGDLLFARSGSVGRTYLYHPDDGPCVFAGYLIRFRALPKVASPKFLSHWTHSRAYFRWVASTARRGAQTNLNATEYSSLPIPLPPLEEQRGIAAVLDSIDEAIEREEAVVAATERLRDAMLQQLLTRGIPGRHTEYRDVPGLGTIPACWEVTRLGEVAEVSFSPVDKKTIEGEKPVYLCNYTDVFYNRHIDEHINFMPATASESEYERWGLKKGDVLFTKDSETPDEIGIPAYVVADMPEVLCGYHLALARPYTHKAVGAFLAEFLRSATARNEFARIANGITRFGLTLDATREFPVPLPSTPEQAAIAEMLDGVEEAINAGRMQTDNLKSLKVSAADALLTGRVRVRGK